MPFFSYPSIYPSVHFTASIQPEDRLHRPMLPCELISDLRVMLTAFPQNNLPLCDLGSFQMGL